ncbi:MAG: hypothetical protein JJU45_10595 [Acidimicrobiia bacterium]|nr:hypothetical protein [Acidimicrobiia bacterium]
MTIDHLAPQIVAPPPPSKQATRYGAPRYGLPRYGWRPPASGRPGTMWF